MRGSEINLFAYDTARTPFEEAIKTGRHLIELNSHRFTYNVANDSVFGCVKVLERERVSAKDRFKLSLPFAIIQSEGKKTFTPNKEWEPGKFQSVINLCPRISWVQVGSVHDVPLKNTLDLRGETSIRELFSLVELSELVVSTESALNHVAAAFGRPSVVVFSGFSSAGLATYPTTVVVAATQAVICSPCGLRTPCPFANKPCTAMIQPEEVATRVNEILGVA